jgi:prolyl oligopeptidase
MKRNACLFASAFLICSHIYAQLMTIRTLPYPQTKKVDTVDTYFGTVVPDPYRWLEDDRADDTKAWVKAENKVTQDYLSQIPFRDAIRKQLETLWNYEKYSAPFKEGKYTYFYKNDGLQNQSVLYRQESDGKPEIFLDPNKFSADGTTSLQGIDFTKDGSLAAYQLSEGGSDWRKVIVINTADKSIIGDTLTDIKFSGVAWHGNDGFFYSSYDKPKAASQLSGMTQYHKLYYHKLGTPQAKDQFIFGGQATPRRYIGAYLTEDEHFLVITAANTTTGNELYLQDLSKPGSSIVNVVNNFDNQHAVLDNLGSKLYIITNLYSPNFKIVTVDAAIPGAAYWKDIIPQTKNVLSATTGGGKIFAEYLKDATSLVQQYNMDGQLERTITLPSVGTASGFGAKKEEKEVYYTFTSYIYPPTIFKYDIASGQSTIYKKSGVQFDPEQYESNQVFYASKDGTKIPMVITYKKGTLIKWAKPAFIIWLRRLWHQLNACF